MKEMLNAPTSLETPAEFLDDRVWIPATPGLNSDASADYTVETLRERGYYAVAPVWLSPESLLAAFPMPVTPFEATIEGMLGKMAVTRLQALLIVDSAWNVIDQYEVSQ